MTTKTTRRTKIIQEIKQLLGEPDTKDLDQRIARAEDAAADGLERVLERELSGKGLPIAYQNPPLDVKRLREDIARMRANAVALRKAVAT
jgi:hypothetical protein